MKESFASKCLICILMMLTWTSCIKEPNESVEPVFGDPDFFTTGKVEKYEGKIITRDSVVVDWGNGDPGTVKWALDTVTELPRQYLVKQLADTIYTTFNKDALNTSAKLTPELLNAHGWFYVSEFASFKFDKDSLWVNGDFVVPAGVNGKLIKRATRYTGVRK